MINEDGSKPIEEWHAFVTEMLLVRDMLEPIISGEIERGHCSPGSRECYGGRPGMRKTMLADAKRLATHAVARINRSVNEFDRL